MNLKALILSILLIAVIATATVMASIIVIQYWYPNTGTIEPTLKIYLDGTLWLNGTEIEWGTCYPNTTYTQGNLTVINNYDENLTISLVTKNLPSTWILTWTANNTLLEPTETAEAELTLFIPANATVWSTWGFYINGKQ